MGTEEVCQVSFLGRGDLSLKLRVHFGGRKYLWFLFISAFKCSDCMTSKIWQPHWFCALLIKSYLVTRGVVISCFLRQWFLNLRHRPLWEYEESHKASSQENTYYSHSCVCNLIVLKLGICTGTSHLNISICLWCMRYCNAHYAMRTQSRLVQYTIDFCSSS